MSPQVAAETTSVPSRRAAVHLVIEPSRGAPSLGAGELWRHRELLYFLVWRDLKVRYKQTALGVAWAILQPLLTAVVFTVLFARAVGLPAGAAPYPLFVFAGLLPWLLFSQGVSQGANSLVTASNLITKVYFPRAVIPIAAILTAAADLLVALPVLAVMQLASGVAPGAALAALPVLVVLAVVVATAVTLWLAALNVRYRDVRYALPFLIQLGLFLTPVIYPADHLAALLAARGLPGWLIGLNPMTAVVEGFRWALLAAPAPSLDLIAASLGATVVVFASGAAYFAAVERSFADVV